jgi:apolipoprotein N-acyltransferase
MALAFAPFLWTGLDLAAARITSVPWDQLGYSQVDNALVNQLAPFTGVYGITFILVAVNALLAGALLVDRGSRSGFAGRWAWVACGAVLFISGYAGVFVPPPNTEPTATAVLIQPNLNVGAADNWPGPEWDRHIAEFTYLAGEECKTYIAGIPQTGAPTGEIICPPYPTHPDLVVWPESPAPFMEGDASFKQAMRSIATTTQSPLVVGGIGMDFSPQENAWHQYNSAFIVDAGGKIVGRYDKIHLVPFGEYIPFQNLLTFAHKLTGRVSSFTRGSDHRVFLLDTQSGGRHRYGVFICYEAVFADEVRQLARNGAEVQRRRSAREHQRRRVVWRHQRAMAAPEHGPHARGRKSPLAFARHQHRSHSRNRSLRPGAREYSAAPGGRVACRIQFPRRDHVLHCSRRRVRVAVCHTVVRRFGLFARTRSAVQN